MMTLLAPIYFFAAVAVAAATVALHFIVTRQPPSSVLPTVRFVPKSTVRIVTLDRPRDPWLLLLRVLTVLLVGLAFAQPVLLPERVPVARIVVADVSRSIGEIGEVRDSVGALLREGDALVVFDRDARVVMRAGADTLERLERAPREGRLSAALVAAMRTAPELRASADSIEIAIVSAFRSSEVDGATQAIRALWPGRIRLVHVAPDADTLAPAAGAMVRAEAADDGVVLAARLAGLSSAESPGDQTVRIVRGEVSEGDSIWVAGGRRTLVHWPAEGAPPGWSERSRVDTAGAVIAGAGRAGAAALVYPLERRWSPPAGETDPGVPPAAEMPAWQVAARWVDGEPAAVERPVGSGCTREVAIPVPGRGDLPFRPSFGQLVRALGAPCEAVAGSTALDEEVLLAIAGAGPLAPRGAIPSPEATPSPLAAWLFGLALLLALAELWVRRGSGFSASAGSPGKVEPSASSARVTGREDAAAREPAATLWGTVS